MALIGNRSRLCAVLVALLLIVATAMRIGMVGAHFGHIDDLGVAATVMQAEAHPPTADRLVAEASRKEAEGHGTQRTRALLRLAGSPAAHRAIDLAGPIFPFFAVPLTWTYPPLPFVATPLLIAPRQGYASVKLWGRLPSLLFSLAAMAMMLAAARRFGRADSSGADWWPLGLAMMAPMATSRELLAMSVQMHSYAATVFVAASILWLTCRDATREPDTFDRRFILRRLLLIFLFCYLSYQALMLIPGYLAALALRSLSGADRRTVVRRLAGPVLIGVGFVVILLPAYLFRLRTIAAVTWNAGPHGEFLFSPGGVGAAIATAPRFLAVNGWLAFEAMTTPVTPDTTASRMFTGLLAVLVGLGLFGCCRAAVRRAGDAREGARALLAYAAVTAAMLLLLVLAGKLTLSPTRHLLLYLPLWCALGGIGLVTLADILRRAVPGEATIAAWPVVLAVAAIAAFPAFRAARVDRLAEAGLAGIAARTHPDLIVDDGLTPGVTLMPALARVAREASLGDPAGLGSGGIAARRVLYVSQSGPIGQDGCRALFGAAGCGAPVRLDTIAAIPALSEVEASPRTRNGGNGLFVQLLTSPPAGRSSSTGTR